jgi:DNA-binding CsgD family transcriptional regulator
MTTPRWQSPRQLFDAIAAAERATCHDALAKAFDPTLQSLGIEMAVVLEVRALVDGPAVAPLFGRHQPGWAALYQSRNYARVDPILRAALVSPVPQIWEEVWRNAVLTPEQAALVADAHSFGLLQGMTMSIGPSEEGILMVALGGRRLPTDTLPSRLALPTCGYFYAVIGRRLRIAEGEAPPPTLSVRQLEVLKWVAVGKTSPEIALILGISVRTVDDYVAVACRKLEVHTRTQAVMQARALGLLTN